MHTKIRGTDSVDSASLHISAYKYSSKSRMFRNGVVMLATCIGLALSGCSTATLPTLTVTNASVVEGNAGTSNLVFTITSDIAPTSAITVTYATSDGTALAGSDYTATNGSLTIPAGATSGSITVPVSGDTVIEPDETFTLTLTDPVNAKLTTGTITGTIINDDFPTVSIAPASVPEGSGGGTTNLNFTVTLSAASASNVSVNYSTTDGTALAASDYTAANATLTIPAGQTTGTITVLVNADTTLEPNETLTLTLSAPAGATLGTATATGTILNDDFGLNDTGITQWSDTIVSNLTVTQAAFPGQDADHGRDAMAAAGTLVKTGGGKAGFDFTKLDAVGQPLANQAATYAATPWDCVRDNVTGLMWEVKTTTPSSLRNMNNVYTWYNSDPYSNGGNAGTPAATPACNTGGACDTEKYVAAVNAAGLCGFSDWRMPKVDELYSLIDFSVPVPNLAIDNAYFPNAIANAYWSAAPYAGNAANAWSVLFNLSNNGASSKANNAYVRLVRGGK